MELYSITAPSTSDVVPKIIFCFDNPPAPVPIKDIPPGVADSITNVSASLFGV